MLVEESQIEESLCPLMFGNFILVGLILHIKPGELPDDTFQPLDGQDVVILVFLLHDGGLIHQLVGELYLALVVALDAALVEHLEG